MLLEKRGYSGAKREEDAYSENRNIITGARVAFARFPSNGVGGARTCGSRARQTTLHSCEIMNEHMRSIFSQLLSQLRDTVDE